MQAIAFPSANTTGVWCLLMGARERKAELIAPPTASPPLLVGLSLPRHSLRLFHIDAFLANRSVARSSPPSSVAVSGRNEFTKRLSTM